MCDCQNRRHFLSIMTASLLLPSMARAQDNTAIRTLSGQLDSSFFKAKTAALIEARSAKTLFVIGGDAFLADGTFRAEVDLDEQGLVGKIKILSGQTLAAFKPRTNRPTELLLPNATGSIRGTGFYVNVSEQKAHDYICCCYGTIAFQDAPNGDRQRLQNRYHNATSIDETGRFVTPPYDQPFGHYDDELYLLESVVGRTPDWQLPDGKMQFLSPEPLPKIG